MKNEILQFMDEYERKGKKVDKTAPYYHLLVRTIPNQLHELMNRNDFLITGSVGQGNTAEIP